MRVRLPKLSVLSLLLGLGLACAAGRMAVRGVGRDGPTPAPNRDKLAVASENATATRVGIDALRSGANAVDAAISIALTLGVVQPASSGIGGGGFALVWDAAQRKVTALDFREVAPGALDPAALEYRSKAPVASGRGRLIGVPGEVAGLAELHRRFGRRSFAEDAAPAVAIAESGYYASDHLARLALAYHSELNWSEPLHALFKPDGWAVGVGRHIVNHPLAATLRRIGAEGPKAFYTGPVAAEMVEAARGTGGFLSVQDLRGVPPDRARAAQGHLGRPHRLHHAASVGGWAACSPRRWACSARPISKRSTLGSGAYTHLLAETFRGAIVDRMRAIGDPAFVKTDVSGLMEKMRLLDRRAHIALDRTRPSPKFFLQEHGTTHFIVVDPQGNVVSLTTTINDAFGAMVSTETTGVILNNELDDFTTKAAAIAFTTGAGTTSSRRSGQHRQSGAERAAPVRASHFEHDAHHHVR